MSQITLNLPPEAVAALADAGREANVSAEEMAAKLIERALLVRRFDLARQQVLGEIGSKAASSDDEVFGHIS